VCGGCVVGVCACVSFEVLLNVQKTHIACNYFRF